jgi:hypothetical protein
LDKKEWIVACTSLEGVAFMKQKKQIGIEWHSKGLRFAISMREKGQKKLLWWDQLTCSISDSGFDSELRRFVEQTKLEGSSVQVAVPRTEVFLEWVYASKKEIRNIPKYLENVFPLPLEKLFWDCQVLSSKTDPQLIFFMAITKDRAKFNKSKMEASGLILNGLSFTGVCHNLPSSILKNKIIGFLKIDGQEGSFAVVHQNVLIYYRDWRLKTDSLDDLCQDVTNTLKTAQINLQRFKLTRVLVIGEESKIGLFVDKIRLHVSIPFEPLNTIALPYYSALAVAGSESSKPWLVAAPSSSIKMKIKQWKKPFFVVILSLLSLSYAGLESLSTRYKNKISKLSTLDRNNFQVVQFRPSSPALTSILGELQNNWNENTYITDINLDTVQNRIHLKARARDHEDASKSIENLRKGNHFPNMVIREARMISSGLSSHINFSAEGNIE